MAPATLARHGLLRAFTGVSLYLLAPALLEVLGAFDRLGDISPPSRPRKPYLSVICGAVV